MALKCIFETFLFNQNTEVDISLNAVIVSSSCSTDETIVADSDEDEEATTSVFANASVNVEEAAKYETESIIVKKPEVCERKEPITERISSDGDKDTCVVIKLDEYNHDETCGNSFDTRQVKREKDDEPESSNSDIIYSQDLIVRSAELPAAATYTGGSTGVVNFKRFRKVVHFYFL